jgi:hypothetical protein
VTKDEIKELTQKITRHTMSDTPLPAEKVKELMEYIEDGMATMRKDFTRYEMNNQYTQRAIGGIITFHNIDLKLQTLLKEVPHV